jgi:SAM-dependent methyltransferase
VLKKPSYPQLKKGRFIPLFFILCYNTYVNLFIFYIMYDYEKFHKNYSADIHDDPARHIKIASLCCGSVIDLGCGTGTLSDYFTGQYTGLDISETAIRKAEEIRRHDAFFDVCDVANDPDLTVAGFDTIVLSEFLEHIENDEHLIKRIIETADEGARLVISVPNDHAFNCDEHVRFFTIPELRQRFSEFGKVHFYNWPGATGQIIMTVNLGLFIPSVLDLVMIVKNEEKGLERAILSCIDYVDSINILVDGSSSDKTLEIAEKYADKLSTSIFNDDFAVFRNMADRLCNSPWRLFLDGHEYLKEINLPACLEDDEYDGCMFDIEMDDGLMFKNPRLYRRGVQFEGAVHEKQMCKKVLNCRGNLIKHDRIGGQTKEASDERAKQRDKMVPEIMKKQLKQNPKNLRALFHLAMFGWSRKNWSMLFKYSKKYLKYSDVKSERWFVFFNVSLAHLFLKHYWRAEYYAICADKNDPGRWEIKKLLGIIYAEQKKYYVAVEYLILSQELADSNGSYRPWIKDSVGTWNLVADCYFHLAEYEKSAHAFYAVSEQTKDNVLKKLSISRAHLMEKMALRQEEEEIK